MSKYIGPHLGKRVEKPDPIIDRSPEQKRIRMEKMRMELAQMGYSIVETEWLRATLLSNLQRPRGRPPRKAIKQIQYSEQAAG